MTKILKRVFFTILLVIFTFPLPSEVNALTTEYKSINEEILSLNDDNSSFQFTRVFFVNWEDSTTPSFGLSGLVYNGNNYDVSFMATATYYDSNFNIVATTYDNQFVPAGEYNSYSHISTLDKINKSYTVDDIAYYKIDVDITKKEATDDDYETTYRYTPSKNSLYNSYEYVIDKYDIDIIVNENNTLDITESITAYFNIPKHGIYRTIPLRNTITRLDGTTSKNRTQITNLSVDNEYTTSYEFENYKIKIGSADQTLTGSQNYIIKYNYNLGKDPVKGYDELYYNIIGNDWDTVIGNVTFTVTMPKDFDSNKLGFSSGKKGSTDNSRVKYNVVGNKITGSYNGILAIGEGLTIRCELEEGYFVGAGLKIVTTIWLMYIIPLLCLIITLVLWYKFGRDNQVIETVEFYPPEGFNSLEVGFLYKGKADNKDVVSLLIYLANKGYIKISETEEKSLFSTSKEFKITKLKEYDGDNANERRFIEGLFKKSKGSNEVTSSDLYDSFYTTMNKILSNINRKENKNKIFEKNSFSKSVIIILLMIISIVTTIAIPTIDYAGISELGLTLLIFIFYVPFFAVGIFAELPLLFRVIWLGFTTFHSLLVFSFSTSSVAIAVVNEPLYLVGVIVGITCLIGIIICFKLMPKRTKYGTEILGKIKGFRNFLETAEKDKLEAMVMQNPNYFYDILPYTYVLGVSDKWIKKFETIYLQAPSWYDSPNAFDIITFESFMNNTIKSAGRSMSTSPSSSSSGGGYSGGGSSGGGSGGGGGGSW